jgi:hypothetical protein
MNEAGRRKLISGWLRVFLGVLQMFLAAAAAMTYFAGGSQSIVWGLVGAALLAVIASRLLYHSDSNQGGKER